MSVPIVLSLCDALQILERVSTSKLEFPTRFGPVSTTFKDFVQRLLQKDREERMRYASIFYRTPSIVLSSLLGMEGCFSTDCSCLLVSIRYCVSPAVHLNAVLTHGLSDAAKELNNMS